MTDTMTDSKIQSLLESVRHGKVSLPTADGGELGGGGGGGSGRGGKRATSFKKLAATLTRFSKRVDTAEVEKQRLSLKPLSVRVHHNPMHPYLQWKPRPLPGLRKPASSLSMDH